ncbi:MULTISPECIES: class I SAM-dependent methyltransferase [unclassified Legionella]|uniref:class I SAM-dependent methyltransferase n=1 Tax=unclassified Legionella TaxID=2622702 RepID=UPI001055C1F5|nr:MULTISPECIES: SAM-dependent methyltransferase [unclassified Legionella]MDI9819640.1 SAM-dependent methyltransferase [Legionella sp. PL877]
MTLLTLLSQQIKQQGAIPFVQFMQQALYAPGLGYYSSGLQKFGPQGDFITAPELTPLFAQTLANQCQQVFSALENPCLFEFGAGSGRLCVDILLQLEKLDALPETYFILEVSSNLKQRQQALVQEKIPHLLDRIHWLDQWPQTPFTGVIIANEVLDAMPVHRFLNTEEGLLESHVTLDDNGELKEIFKPCSDQRLQAYVATVLADDLLPYQSEANLFMDGWIQQCYAMLEKGVVLLIDYGFPRHEYYHPDRNMGTLMCHYQHQAHGNPLIHPGEQDITAHVDFTQVAETAHAAGFHIAGYTNQASFLLACGLLSLFAQMNDEPGHLNRQQAVKQLLQPSEMGELFKVIALTKKLDIALMGFQLQDKRASL